MTTLYQLLVVANYSVYDSPLLLHKSVYDYQYRLIILYMTVLYYSTSLCKTSLYQLLVVANYSVCDSSLLPLESVYDQLLVVADYSVYDSPFITSQVCV